MNNKNKLKVGEGLMNIGGSRFRGHTTEHSILEEEVLEEDLIQDGDGKSSPREDKVILGVREENEDDIVVDELNDPIDKVDVDDQEGLRYYDEDTSKRIDVYSKASILSKLLFEFATPLIYKGFKTTIQDRDIWEIPKQHNVKKLDNLYDSQWEQKKHRRIALPLTLLSIFGFRFLFAGLIRFVADLCQVMQPMVLRNIVLFLASDKQDGSLKPWYIGLIYIVVMMLLMYISSICLTHFSFMTSRIGMDVSSILTTKVYQKGIRLSNKAKQNRTIGEIVNLMSIDIRGLKRMLSGQLHFVYLTFIKLTISLALLYTLIGWVCIVGFGVIILSVPIQIYGFKLVVLLRRKLLKFSDRRLKAVHEILQGIRILKFFSWEQSYMGRIIGIRKSELLQTAKMNFVRAILSSVSISSPILVSVITFGLYALMGNELRADIVFPTLAYFNLIRRPLNRLMRIINRILDSIVSTKRLSDFFNEEEIIPVSQVFGDKDPIRILNGNFEWDEMVSNDNSAVGGKENKQVENNSDISELIDKNESQEMIDQDSQQYAAGRLHDITVTIPKGSLTFIVGRVGSGKSSFLDAIVGEMRKTEGILETCGTIAYCPQQAWIQNTTLRQNILFGQRYDAEKVEKILDICCLRSDLETLPNGEMTEIGEKGINLSGGQRQRINLARSVYSDKDIYLLDDILSAVDSHVGKKIFNECILDHLKDKTRVFVTHQLQYLSHGTQIIVMDQGRISEIGTYEELSNRENGYLKQMLNEYLCESDRSQDTETNCDEFEKTSDDKLSVIQIDEQEVSVFSEEKKKKQGRLMTKEERYIGTVSWKVLSYYMNAIGGVPVLIILSLLFIIREGGSIASSTYMALWSGGRLSSLGLGSQISIYASLGAIQVIAYIIRELCTTAFCLYGSYIIHKQVLNRVMRAPMSFFDTTPSGRILSRFSKDQEAVDTSVPANSRDFIGQLLQVVTSFSMMIYGSPWFIIPLVPIDSHFTESLSGISTIRAYRAEQRFICENQEKIDIWNRTSFTEMVLQKWLNFRFQLLGSTLVSISAGLIVLSRGNIAPEIAGLVLSYATQTTSSIQDTLELMIDVESGFNSVERLMHYAKKIPNEPAEIIEDERPSEGWPDNGLIEFNQYSMKYRENLPYVLKNITLTFYPGEKIGVVGRTGAGKSSLMLAIYRMADRSEGRISIDGQDIEKIGICDLRKKLSIIPQDPILFSGTIRSNLDPFNEYSDDYLWDVLEKSYMKSTIEKLPNQLESFVAEGGENFSVGQKQLLCLARALTKRTKILIMDEVTASVDYETDSIIQKTVREEFSDCTRITIAHRLNTIMDSDRILVLENGEIAEFDKPSVLAQDSNSLLSSLLKSSSQTFSLKSQQGEAAE